MKKYVKYCVKQKGGDINVSNLTGEEITNRLGSEYNVDRYTFPFKIIKTSRNNSVSVDLLKKTGKIKIQYLNDNGIPAKETDEFWPSGEFITNNVNAAITAIKNAFYDFPLNEPISYFKNIPLGTKIKELESKDIIDLLKYCKAPTSLGEKLKRIGTECLYNFDKIHEIKMDNKNYYVGTLKNKYLYHKQQKILNKKLPIYENTKGSWFYTNETHAKGTLTKPGVNYTHIEYELIKPLIVIIYVQKTEGEFKEGQNLLKETEQAREDLKTLNIILNGHAACFECEVFIFNEFINDNFLKYNREIIYKSAYID